MNTPQQQALAALLSFSRTARTEDRSREGFYRLGESPEDMGYHVKVTLSVRHDAASKSYHAQLTVSEERIEGGFAAQRHGFGMPSRDLGTIPAPRFSSKRLEAIYSETLAALKQQPAPLIDLLEEESER